MLKLKIIGSSSHGNAYILSNNDTTIMLDCGTKKVMETPNINEIDGIFITHQHLDHCGGVKYIKNYYNGKYYSHKEVLDILPILDNQKVEVKTGEKFQIGTFSCKCFELQHDCTCYGIVIKDEVSSAKLVYITDTGSINFRFKDISYYIIESNCDENLLTYEDYKEVRLYDTHLSMQQVGKFLKENTNHNTKKVILCHISTSEQDYLKHERYIKDVISNENIEVKAIDPHMKEPLEIVLKEDLQGFDFN